MKQIILFKQALPTLAPIVWLNMAFGFSILIVSVSLWIAMHQPTIGVTLKYAVHDNTIRVMEVYPNGAAMGKLRPGDILSAIGAPGRPMENLSEKTLVEDPDYFGTYAEYQAFFTHQQALYNTMIAPLFEVLLGNGQRITLQSKLLRPLKNLPASFWGLQLLGNLGFLIGMSIWIYRRDSLETRLLAVAGLGFMVGASCLSIYSTRELVIFPVLFQYLTIINYTAFDMFLYALALLLWHYPKKILKRPLFWQTGLWIVLQQLNNYFQFLVIPGHVFVLQGLLPFSLCVLGAHQQWRKSRQDPLSRASLRWLLLAIFVPAIIVLVIVCKTYLIDEYCSIPLWVSELLLFSIFIGLVLGILKYRLFSIEGWWWQFWLWFLSGLLLICMDMVLMYIFHIYPLNSLTLAIILSAWLYFPLRQWLLGFSKTTIYREPENLLAGILETIAVNHNCEQIEHHWETLITNYFRPLTAERLLGIIEHVALKEQGLTIVVPALYSPSHLQLTGMDRGGRLFSPRDVSVVQKTFLIAKQSSEWHETREQTARQEREMIVRDLHDDVGAALLSLVYTAQTEEQSKLAKQALNSLRETMHVLKDDRMTTLSEHVLAWQSEIQQRMDSANVNIDWSIPAELPYKLLNSRQRINLDRILREALSNILKHSQPKHVCFACYCENTQLYLILEDDGLESSPENWKPHGGLFNMRKRADEIQACLAWDRLSCVQDKLNGTRFTVSLQI